MRGEALRPPLFRNDRGKTVKTIYTDEHRHQDGKLEFAVQKPSLNCDRLSMKLKELRAGSHEFEGTANTTGKGQYSQGFDYTLTVSAKPR